MSIFIFLACSPFNQLKINFTNQMDLHPQIHSTQTQV